MSDAATEPQIDFEPEAIDFQPEAPPIPSVRDVMRMSGVTAAVQGPQPPNPRMRRMGLFAAEDVDQKPSQGMFSAEDAQPAQAQGKFAAEDIQTPENAAPSVPSVRDVMRMSGVTAPVQGPQLPNPMVAQPKNKPPANYDTPLTPGQESRFQQWKQQYAPKDSGEDYDLRGAYLAGLKPDPQTGHWPDTFKKPNEPTFSVESKYAQFAPEKAGRWEGPNHDQFVPPAAAAPNSTVRDVMKMSQPWRSKEQSDADIGRIAQGPKGAPPVGTFGNRPPAISAPGVAEGEPPSEADRLFAAQRQASERRVGAPLTLEEKRIAPIYGRDREFGDQNYTTSRGGFPSRQITPQAPPILKLDQPQPPTVTPQEETAPKQRVTLVSTGFGTPTWIANDGTIEAREEAARLNAAEGEAVRGVTGVAGYPKIAAGAKTLVPTSTQPYPSAREVMGAGAEVLGGAGQALTPAAIVGGVTAPWTTAGARLQRVVALRKRKLQRSATARERRCCARAVENGDGKVARYAGRTARSSRRSQCTRSYRRREALQIPQHASQHSRRLGSPHRFRNRTRPHLRFRLDGEGQRRGRQSSDREVRTESRG